MEIKCDICGTINDGSTNFCKGCFQKLDAERKQNVAPEADNTVVSVIEKEAEKEVPWNNDETVENVVPNPTPVVDNWEPVGVNGEIKNEEVVEEVTNDSVEESLDQTEVLDFNELPSNETVQVNSSINDDMEVVDQNNNLPEAISATDLPNINNEQVEEVIEPITESENDAVELIEDNSEIQKGANEEIEEVIEPITESENDTVEPIEDNSEIQKDVNEEIEEVIEPISELGEEPIVDDIKTVNDDWSKDPIEESEEIVKEPKYILKFTLIYLISIIIVFGTLIMTTKYLNKVFDNVTSDIVSFALYRLAALFTLIISTVLTFKKQVPKIEKMNSITFKILGFIAIPSILIQLFVLGFIKNTKVLMFIIGIMLSLIILVIFFSYIRNTIKKKNQVHIDDKVFFIYGIINIILIIGLLGLGIYARSNDLNMPKINFLYTMFNDTSKDEEIVQKFINQVQLKILENQETIENYEFPEVIDDVSFASYDEYTPDEINLKLNNEGAIINGTIKYHNITYSYDGEKIKVK